MRKVYEYSHLGGLEILRLRYPRIEKEIDKIIEEVGTPGKTALNAISPASLSKSFWLMSRI